MASDLDAGPPPLEDFSDVIDQLHRQKLTHASPTLTSATHPDDQKKAVNITEEKLTQSRETTVPAKSNPKSTTSPSQNSSQPSKKKVDFGGLKKGFLFGGAPSKASQEHKKETEKRSKAKEDSIPYLTKQEPKSNPLKFSEVEDALKANTALLDNKDWVTEDLLQKVASSPSVGERLSDPTFMQALAEFQKNPQAATAKYQDNAEVHQFFQEFCGMLGEHFTNLGGLAPKTDGIQTQPSEASSTITDPQDTEVQKILADDTLRETLVDPQIQKLLQLLRTSPGEAQRFLYTADTELKKKVNLLIDAGLLQMQSL